MNFQWLNESNLTKEGEKITIYAPAGTDFFCNDGTVSERKALPRNLFTMHLFIIPNFPATLY